MTTGGGHLTSDLEAVLFDFYGTLAEAEGFTHDGALGALLGALDVEVPRDRFEIAYRKQIRSYFRVEAAAGREQHNTVWVSRALAELGHDLGPDDPVVTRAVDAYFELYQRSIRWYPWSADTLDRLGGRYRVGLVSNFTDSRPVRGALAQDGYKGRFGSIVISSEVGRRKPHPAIFARALGELGVPAERALYVGDDPADDVAGAAAAAGMRTASIEGSGVTMLRSVDGGQPPRRVAADVTVSSVAELVPLLLG